MSELKALKKIETDEEQRALQEHQREQLLDQIAEDAKRAPEQWLEEAEVPKGGE